MVYFTFRILWGTFSHGYVSPHHLGTKVGFRFRDSMGGRVTAQLINMQTISPTCHQEKWLPHVWFPPNCEFAWLRIGLSLSSTGLPYEHAWDHKRKSDHSVSWFIKCGEGCARHRLAERRKQDEVDEAFTMCDTQTAPSEWSLRELRHVH